MITRENLTLHELVGIQAEILDSSNRSLIGLNGRIEDETKSMIALNTKNGMKMIAKKSCVWGFEINYDRVVVKGSKIAKRSYDRLRENK